jgi:hypothetical protein
MEDEDMYSETIARLEKFDHPHDFERMSADILNALEYRDVVPIAPRGGSDGGKDITFTTANGGKGLAWVTVRKDIEKKFREDSSQRIAGEYDEYFLFCTAHLKAKQKNFFSDFCASTLNASFKPFDIEGLRSLLDGRLLRIREQYLHIPSPAGNISSKTFQSCKFLLASSYPMDTLPLHHNFQMIGNAFSGSVCVEPDITIEKFKKLLVQHKFDIVHVYGVVLDISDNIAFGTFKSEPEISASVDPELISWLGQGVDYLPWQGVMHLLTLSNTKLFILPFINSSISTEKLAKNVSLISIGKSSINNLNRWEEMFYGFLSKGYPLSEAFIMAKNIVPAYFSHIKEA